MKKAVVLLSGGIDSSTTLAIARAQGFECYALSVKYQQRNVPELQAAKRVANSLSVKEHRVIFLEIGAWGGSALTDHELAVPQQFSDDIPITYVPARNTVLLSAALGWAEVLGAQDIFFGANIVDYSNYPDCRPDYIEAFTQVANLATRAGREGNKFTIHAPLINMNKAEIIQQGAELGVDFALTLSCYSPDSAGGACKKCDACRHRAKGFKEAGIADVTHYS